MACKMTNGSTKRVVALVDMDCFYCQVETRLNPELKGKPVAVVQYNQWQGGGIIAVNYEAKDKGVTRGMRGAKAQTLCPDINLVSVPVLRGKADLSKYRSAGEEVAQIFSVFSDCIQRSSIDEAYIDLTKAVENRIKNGFTFFNESNLKSTYIVGYSDLNKNVEDERRAGVRQWINLINDSLKESPDFQLTVGAMIVEEMRAQILEKTGFHCSAGIAHNKVLAKLIAGLHKPKHQTILPQDNVPELYESLPIYKISSLGGKFGKYVSDKLSVRFMSELYKYSLRELQQKFDEKSGNWLYNIARGIDLEPVTPRLIPESIGCCKNFPGLNILSTKSCVEKWIRELADEISERLKADLVKNKRRAKLLTVSFYQTSPMSRSDALISYEANCIADRALHLLKKFNNAPSHSSNWEPPIKFLGLSVGKFMKEQTNIDSFLSNKSTIPQSLQCKPICEPPAPAPSTSKSLESSEVKSVTPEESKINADESEKSFFLNFMKNNRHKFIKRNPQQIDRKKSPSENLDSNVVQEEISNESSNLTNKNQCPVYPNDCVEVGSSDNDFTYEFKLCEECNQNINILDFFEHLDYHTAVKLQSEINAELRLNQRSSTSNSIRKSSGVVEGNNKRKRLKGPKTDTKKFRDIKSFFPVITK